MTTNMDAHTTRSELDPIDPMALRTNPALATASVNFDGVPVTFRMVKQDDAPILGDYFVSLSAETIRRYGPHPFDRATAEQLCATTDPTQTLRMIGTVNNVDGERVIAYMILILGVREADVERYKKLGITLTPTGDCTLAPSVADAYQGKGLGSLLMVKLKRLARQLGRTRMVLWEGTQATNNRAIRFYHKNGFRTVGEFQEPPGFYNYDMILDL